MIAKDPTSIVVPMHIRSSIGAVTGEMCWVNNGLAFACLGTPCGHTTVMDGVGVADVDGDNVVL